MKKAVYLKIKKLIVSYLLGIGTVLFFIYQILPGKNLVLSFLDVGQGDSVLIQTPNGHNILVDGGPGNTIIEKLNSHLAFFSKEIDLLVLTHPHADHVQGLIEVLKRYKVKNVLFSGINSDSPDYNEFLQILIDRKINFYIANQHQDFRFDNLVLDVLYPFESLEFQNISNLNNSSIVLKLIYLEKGEENPKKVLLTGDMEQEIENLLLNEKVNLEADILKIGHHGSNTSSTMNFLGKVKPKISVIQAGVDNQFNHPEPEVIYRLELLGSKIFRNDLDGDITLEF